MGEAQTVPIIRARDGAIVAVGDKWNTGDVTDLDGRVVAKGDDVELLSVDIPPKGEGRIACATVRLGSKIISGPMMVRTTHPGFPGRRVAFIEI